MPTEHASAGFYIFVDSLSHASGNDFAFIGIVVPAFFLLPDSHYGYMDTKTKKKG